MLHVDIGITAMGMSTDTQHLAYILRSNETAPPHSLIKGLHDANKMQDFVRQRMVPGTTGDDVFFAVLDDMKHAKLDGLIYCHPIGDYGHSAGASIGMANIQGRTLSAPNVKLIISGPRCGAEQSLEEVLDVGGALWADPRPRVGQGCPRQ